MREKITVIKASKDHTLIPNSLLTDRRLSFDAIGVGATMFALGSCDIKDLQKCSSEKDMYVIENAIAELVKYGYVEVEDDE